MSTIAMLVIGGCGILVILSGLWVACGLWRELFSNSHHSSDSNQSS
jgi:hypothetical protein